MTLNIVMPKDAAVRNMCEDLSKMREGLAVLGLQAPILDQVSAKLTDMALEVERVRSERAYLIGHNDGWEAAMSTGLPEHEQG